MLPLSRLLFRWFYEAHMTEMEQLIDRIAEKAEAVMDRCGLLERENKALLEQTATINNQLEQKQLALDELQRKNEMLRVAGSLTGEQEGDSGQAKQKISELVREIDKCIALLNK